MKLDPFYPIIDSGLAAKAGKDPLELARALTSAGAKLVQFRHKEFYSRQAYELAQAIGRIVQQAGATYIVNDRADIAMMLAADGVHVGQDDLPPAEVRKLVGPDMLIGYSTHNEQQLRAGDREPVNYLALGPIFGTMSKENPDPVVGIEELVRLRVVTRKPLVAIGGLTRQNAADVLNAGADAVVVLSDLLGKDMPERAEQWIALTRDGRMQPR